MEAVRREALLKDECDCHYISKDEAISQTCRAEMSVTLRADNGSSRVSGNHLAAALGSIPILFTAIIHLAWIYGSLGRVM